MLHLGKVFILSTLMASQPSLVKSIQTLKPKIQKTKAEKIAVAVSKCTAVEPKIFVAILYLESRFELNPKHINPDDMGIGGLNMYWWEKPFKVDKERLVTDIAYAVDLSCKVLHIKKKEYPKDKYYWATYHNAKQPFKQRYINYIKRILRKMNDKVRRGTIKSTPR